MIDNFNWLNGRVRTSLASATVNEYVRVYIYILLFYYQAYLIWMIINNTIIWRNLIISTKIFSI